MVSAGKKRKTKRGSAAIWKGSGEKSQFPAWARWLLPTLLALVTFVAFSPALENRFVDWDDETALLANTRYRGLAWAELRWMFTTFYMGHYQPLSWVSFGLDYTLWGLDPLGYHLTNVLIHGANAVLFYFVSRRLLSRTLSVSDAGGSRSAHIAAGLAALLFAIHPLRVESVAWVTERRDVLSGLFFLMTLLFYVRAHASAAPNANKRRWVIASLIAYALSLFSKAAGMTLPFLLVVLDIYPLRRLTAKWLDRADGWVWLEKVPFFLLGVGVGFLAFLAQQESRAMQTVSQYGVLSRLAQALYGLTFYLWKTLLPFGLSPIYEIPRGLSLWEPRILISGFAVLGITVGLFVVRRRWPTGLAIWAFYVILLAPVLGFFQSGPQFVAGRYSYLSCLGWALLGGAALHWLWQVRARGRLNVLGFKLILGVAGAVLIVLGGLTWRQTKIWKDSETLWRHTIGIGQESSFAHYNLANILLKRGDIDEAMRHYRESLRINPAGADAHYNLGTVLSERGELDEAMGHFRKALQLDPQSSDVHTNLAGVLVRRGKVEEAIDHYQKALQIRPNNPWAHFNLGSILAGQGKFDEAAEHYRQVLKLNPDDAEAHHNLGKVLASRGRLEEAMEHFREALRLQPDFATAHESLGRSLALLGRRKEAVGHFEEALRIMRSGSTGPTPRSEPSLPSRGVLGY